MGKVVWGFLGGIALTCIVFVRFIVASNDEAISLQEFDADSSSSASRPQAEAVVVAEPDEADNAAPIGEPEEAETAEIRPASSVAANAEYFPIALPPEFDFLVAYGEGSQADIEAWREGRFMETLDLGHRLIEAEPVDPDWAYPTEAELNRYFTDRPELLAKYGYPTVNCRSTKCEIAIVAYGLNAEQYDSQYHLLEERPDNFFFQDNVDIFEQPWAEQFAMGRENSPTLQYKIYSQDGITTIIWHLNQKEELQETRAISASTSNI